MVYVSKNGSVIGQRLLNKLDNKEKSKFVKTKPWGIWKIKKNGSYNISKDDKYLLKYL